MTQAQIKFWEGGTEPQNQVVALPAQGPPPPPLAPGAVQHSDKTGIYDQATAHLDDANEQGSMLQQKSAPFAGGLASWVRAAGKTFD